MSSSEDDTEAFRDVVECDYIRNLYSGIQPDSKQKEKKQSLRTEPKHRKNAFREHIAKKLFDRLERELVMVEPSKKEKVISKENEPKTVKRGIKLFSHSVNFLTLDDIAKKKVVNKEDSAENVRKKRKAERREEKMRLKRAAEVAVSGEWILSGEGTKGWKDAKKPRVTQFTVIKKIGTGAIVCSPCLEPSSAV